MSVKFKSVIGGIKVIVMTINLKKDKSHLLIIVYLFYIQKIAHFS